MAIVSTGQITIVDTNDARPITAYLTTNPGTQQVFTKDESTLSFTPSWMTANGSTGLEIAASVFVGGTTGAVDVTNSLSNRKFCLSVGGAAITNATTSTSFVNDAGVTVSTPFTVLTDASNTYLRIKGNLLDTVAAFVVYFEADYTDPATGLASHIIASITLNTVKTGTNAVFINLRGKSMIEQATGSTKSVTAISADLVRSGGIDTSGLTYKWYAVNAGTQISTSLAGYATKYGFKTVAAPATPIGAVGELNTNIPTAGAGNAHNTLVVSEAAITDQDVFRVDITDGDSKTYSAYFTVYDVSDPYELRIISSTGDKLQNGQGSTTLTPLVYYGATPVASLTGWTFTWYFYDKDGKRGAFVDTGKIAMAGGGAITANTTGASASFTSTAITAGMFVAGSIIKCVKPTGEAFFYEVGATSTVGAVTIRTPVTNTWLNYAAPAATTDFVNGRIFGCTAGGTRSSSGAAGITLTGDEVDVKTVITAEANRP